MRREYHDSILPGEGGGFMASRSSPGLRDLAKDPQTPPKQAILMGREEKEAQRGVLIVLIHSQCSLSLPSPPLLPNCNFGWGFGTRGNRGTFLLVFHGAALRRSLSGHRFLSYL